MRLGDRTFEWKKMDAEPAAAALHIRGVYRRDHEVKGEIKLAPCDPNLSALHDALTAAQDACNKLFTAEMGAAAGVAEPEDDDDGLNEVAPVAPAANKKENGGVRTGKRGRD